jgi:uncharacterized RDD family membrane protein YckC
VSNGSDASESSAPTGPVTAYEQLTIETPEQIALEFALAGVGSRFLALAIDTLIQLSIGIGLLLTALGAVWILATRGSLRSSGGGIGSVSAGLSVWVLATLVLLLFLVWYGYFAIFEIAWRGQTPGKRVIGLRVIGSSGRPMTATQAILRNLLRIVDQLPGLYAVGIISVLLTSRNQRLGDLAASTVVVHERPSEGQHAVPNDDDDDDNRTHVRDRDPLSASRLTDQEIAVIERFFERRDDLDLDVRERTAQEIANRVRQRLGLAPGEHDENLLRRLLTEYRTFGSYR